MKEIWIMLSGACIWLENIYDMAMQLKLKRAWKIEISLRKKVNFSHLALLKQACNLILSF